MLANFIYELPGVPEKKIANDFQLAVALKLLYLQRN